jgi:ribosomal protein S18 acetylase RimI-like enzyme
LSGAIVVSVKDYQIRQAQRQDADALAALVNGAYRGDYARQGWTTEADLIDGTRTDANILEETLNRQGATILVYEVKGSILGCVELVRQPPNLYLGMLTVDPATQGKGVGKILMEAAEEFGRKVNCTAVNMTVISVRTELIDWYKRRGYVDSGKRKPFAFSDPRFGKPKQPLEFIVMEKAL